MAPHSFSHVVGFDDCPFQREHRGNVPIIGAVFANSRLEGVLRGSVRRDGANATRILVRLIAESKYSAQLQLVMLQGIAFAGFNVVDLPRLHRELDLPVLVVVRKRPRLERIRNALERVPGGKRKWALIQRLGPVEPVGSVFVQRVGLSLAEAATAIARHAIHGTIPEPLRTAHLIAGGITTGQSTGRT
ncbi:MAG: DUF99 family protein [Gemmatimonadota bacterium]|nr:MAG: DUF99 family protein [Gemmatimonadota bacterium]